MSRADDIEYIEGLFPENGLTKGEVIAFYSQTAETILPHLKDRPLTLKRYPDGVEGEHFYEKNAPSHTPPWVRRFECPKAVIKNLCGSPKRRWRHSDVLCNDTVTLILGD